MSLFSSDYGLIENLWNEPPSKTEYYFEPEKYRSKLDAKGDGSVYMNFGGDGIYCFSVVSNREHSFGPQVVEALNRIGTLYEAIEHGDEKHRAWLKKAIRDHFSGKEVGK